MNLLEILIKKLRMEQWAKITVKNDFWKFEIKKCNLPIHLSPNKSKKLKHEVVNWQNAYY
jgi:hypothetical protein